MFRAFTLLMFTSVLGYWIVFNPYPNDFYRNIVIERPPDYIEYSYESGRCSLYPSILYNRYPVSLAYSKQTSWSDCHRHINEISNTTLLWDFYYDERTQLSSLDRPAQLPVKLIVGYIVIVGLTQAYNLYKESAAIIYTR